MDESFLSDPDEESGGSGLVKAFLLALALMVGLTIFVSSSGLWQALGNAPLTPLGG